MRKFKLIVSVLLSMCFVFGLLGCPNSNKGPNKIPEKTPLEEKYDDLGISEEGAKLSEEKSKEVIEKLQNAGLVEGEDYSVIIIEDEVQIILTEKGKEKLENQVKAESGEITGDTISIDVTDEAFLHRTYYYEPEDVYTVDMLTDTEEINLGDKLNIKFKATVSTDIALVEAGVFYKDEDWGKQIMEEFAFSAPNECIQGRTRDSILFRDGSSIRMVKADSLSVRGYKFDKIFVQQGIDEEFINTYLRPLLVNRNNKIYEEFIDEETKQKCFL